MLAVVVNRLQNFLIRCFYRYSIDIISCKVVSLGASYKLRVSSLCSIMKSESFATRVHNSLRCKVENYLKNNIESFFV